MSGSPPPAGPPRVVREALRASIPVLLGYFPIGVAFGLLVRHSGYPWFLAPLMSLVIYAGAAQFAALGFFASGAGLGEVAVMTLLLNSRHMVYGLSMLESYRGAGSRKPYLIYALTDETFALHTGLTVPEGIDSSRYSFWISLLNQSYWVAGSITGALLATRLPISLEGLDFALVALFAVLVIDQYKRRTSLLPFPLAGVIAVAAMFLSSSSLMLLGSIAACLGVLDLADALRRER